MAVFFGIVALAALATPDMSALADVADREIEWSVGPAAQTGLDGRISLRHSLDPGAQTNDAIAVTNLSESAATFSVATGTGVIGADGAFDIVQADQDEGQWVEVDGLEAGQVTLAPGEVRILPVRIQVPVGAAPGDHPAGIAVGLSQGQALTVTNRIGVRVHLRVNGEVAPALSVSVTGASFSPSWIPFAPGKLTVGYEVAATGNVRLGARASAESFGLFGIGKSTVQDNPITELLPGEKTSRTMTLDAPALFWLWGDVSVVPTVVGEDEVSPPQALAADFSVAAVPWTGVAVVLLLAGTITAVKLRARRATP
ncbi:MAG: DUF916 domain-containing protein [Propionibacteriaceae bacterium]|nr:DUF916 domain-containing protein [Propionibacteriaceae bacterium]